jgi:Zn-finger nucleic acid-binding protein
MNCPCCSAPLTEGDLHCSYCGSRLDVDLQGWARATSDGFRPDLSCPEGHGPLETIRIGAAADLPLDRCPVCLGMFLERGALDALLRQAVGPVWEVDTPLLNRLAENPRSGPGRLRYLPCPACGTMMNRSLFGRRSGVIVDRCRSHGTWLEAGELRQLLEWTRAGGALRHQEQEAEARLAEERQRRQEAAERAAALAASGAGGADGPWRTGLEDDLLALLGRLLWGNGR